MTSNTIKVGIFRTTKILRLEEIIIKMSDNTILITDVGSD